jgi:UDP-N-acetylmuramoylalanine--D-glutamate ligase
MVKVIVGYGKTGQSVARHFERTQTSYWVAEDRLSNVAKEQLEQAPHCVGFGSIDDLVPSAEQSWIVSPGIPLSKAIFETARIAGVELINDLQLFRPLIEGRVVGVTGSNGKSTVVTMVTHIAKALNIKAVAAGNIGLPVLDALVDQPELMVVELSSYQLELGSALGLDVAALINLMPDHLDRYDSVDTYYRTKESIFNQAQVRVSYEAWRSERKPKRMSQSGRGTWLAFGYSPPSQDQSTVPQGVTVSVSADSLRFEFEGESVLIAKRGPWLSRHNAINGAAALAICIGLGLPLVTSAQCLETFEGLPHRCEVLPTKDGVLWINDSKATNVSAAVSAIESFRDAGPLILILGGRPKQEDFSPLLKALSHTPQLKALVLYGEAASLISDQLSDEWCAMRRTHFREAVDLAFQTSSPGDVILFSPACASFDQFENFEARGDAFRQQVLEMAA